MESISLCVCLLSFFFVFFLFDLFYSSCFFNYLFFFYRERQRRQELDGWRSEENLGRDAGLKSVIIVYYVKALLSIKQFNFHF